MEIKMNEKRKMNGLYKTASILLLICIPLFFSALVVAYLFENEYLSVAFSGGGVFLAFLGIIFASLSKPKKVKQKTEEEFSEITVDTD